MREKEMYKQQREREKQYIRQPKKPLLLRKRDRK